MEQSHFHLQNLHSTKTLNMQNVQFYLISKLIALEFFEKNRSKTSIFGILSCPLQRNLPAMNHEDNTNAKERLKHYCKLLETFNPRWRIKFPSVMRRCRCRYAKFEAHIQSLPLKI
jgi:hypothetical protein